MNLTRAIHKRLSPAEAGRAGEAAAAAYLSFEGFRILRTNYRTASGEVDIIAEKDGRLSFVEVRTRRSRRYGTPEESLTERKAARLIAVAEAFIQQEYGISPPYWGIDFVAIEMNAVGKVLSIRFYKDAVSDKKEIV